MIIYECPYCKNHMDKLEDICPDCGAQNGEFRRIEIADPNPPVIDHPPMQQKRFVNTKEDSYAIASFAMGCASFMFNCMGFGALVGIPAIVLGIMGRKTQRKVFAVLGILFGIMNTAFSVFIFTAAILSM